MARSGHWPKHGRQLSLGSVPRPFRYCHLRSRAQSKDTALYKDEMEDHRRKSTLRMLCDELRQQRNEVKPSKGHRSADTQRRQRGAYDVEASALLDRASALHGMSAMPT